MPPNLQILHIEQEVAGGTASVLEMVPLPTPLTLPLPRTLPLTLPLPRPYP